MGLISEIIRIARGNASSTAPETVESIEAALAKIASERADARLQIQSGHDKRRDLLRADASDAEIAAFDTELDSFRLKLERLELVEDDLLGRLEAARSDRRQAQWNSSFGTFEVAFAQYVSDLRQALSSFEALVAVKEEARRMGFEHETASQMPIEIPMFADLAVIAAAESNFARICESAAGRPREPQRRLATPDTAKLPTRLSAATERPTTPVKPKEPPRTRRSAVHETAKAGETLVTVVRSGFEAPSGMQCALGDVVSLPAEKALAAARSGAVEFVQEGTNARA